MKHTASPSRPLCRFPQVQEYLKTKETMGEDKQEEEEERDRHAWVKCKRWDEGNSYQ